MFGRKRKYEVRVPLTTLTTSSEPTHWPWGWAQCPTCECGRRVEDDVCQDCEAKGLTYDWSGGDKTLSYEEVRRIKSATQLVRVEAGNTLTWQCNYAVTNDAYETLYRCPFKVEYRIKQPGHVDMGQPPEAMLVHIHREGHYTVGGF